MIIVTKLNNEKLYVNSDMIEIIEVTPDTMLTFYSGKKLTVLERAEEVIDRIIEFKRKVVAGVPEVYEGHISDKF